MRKATASRLVSLLLAGTIIFSPGGLTVWDTAGIAWADDDDDGGGGGDNDDGGASGNDDDDGGGRASRRDDDDDDGVRRTGRTGNQPARQTTRPRRAVPPPAPAPPPPVRAGGEIVTFALAGGDLASLLAEGYEVIEEYQGARLAGTSRRLRVPDGTTLEAARERVRLLPSGQDADFNHYFRSEQGFAENCVGADCPARLSIGWPLYPSRPESCGRNVTIGMIDTGINDAHDTFGGARIDVHRTSDDALDRSRAIHGTAVAALLVGDPATRSPGLVPGARLIAVDAFHRAGVDERVDVFTLIESLDFLAEQGAEVINLSFAGPANAVLAETVSRLSEDNRIVLVSAAGNAGPRAKPQYPAAYDEVLAVTAVDRRGNVYRRAGRGEHIDLSAPGVNVWTAASISGARWKTGTSFAAPFVTAAAAILRENQPDLGADAIREELRQRATDLGEPGRDDVFGAGLLNPPQCRRPL